MFVNVLTMLTRLVCLLKWLDFAEKIDFLQEAKYLFWVYIIEQKVEVWCIVVSAPDISELSTVNKNVLYSEGLLWVTTKVTWWRYFVRPSLFKEIFMCYSCVTDSQWAIPAKVSPGGHLCYNSIEGSFL